MKTPCLILPHAEADGPANMALDEALLDAAAEAPGRAFFRTYGWTEATLSLGYFQHLAQARSEPRWLSVPIVRRPTGGGAIWHHHELTYALVVPTDHPRAGRGGMLYHEVHAAIARVLRALGADAQPRGPSPADPAGRPLLCFRDRDAEDLVVAGSKVVGSAQRRRAGAVLQHGSILLKQSATTPELPGLLELAGVAPDVASLAERLVASVAESLSLAPEPALAPLAAAAHARVLEQAVYRNPAWNARR
jgi:lipoate-protein ligase A